MTKFKGLYIFAALGLLLGIWIDRQFYADNLRVIYYIFPVLYACLFALAYNGNNTIRLLFSSLIFAVILSLPILAFSFGEEPPNINHVICFLTGYPIFIYIGHCYHYAFHQDSTYKINYKALYAAVWNTIPLVGLALLFVAFTQIIFMLGAYAYKSIGSDFLWALYFEEKHFRIITNALFFFVGLSICQQNIQIIYSLRLIIMKAMYYLFPFVVLITISYFFFIFSNTIFYKQSIPINLNVMIPLIFLGVIFFNAYIQDVDDNSVMPASYNIFIKFYRVILFILTVMLANTVINEYTFDINICVYLLSGLAVTMIYCLTVFLPQDKEFQYIRLGNIYVALYYVIALFLLNIPYYPVVIMLNI